MLGILNKIRPLNSIINLKIQYLGVLNYSFYSRYKTKLKLAKIAKLAKLNKPPKIPRNQRINSEKVAFLSLFNDITDILGAGNLTIGGNIEWGSVSSSVDECTPGVRRNAPERSCGESGGVCDEGGTQLGDEAGNDVSEVVEGILEVVRGDHGEDSMEGRLVESGFEMSGEIVGEVLGRCLREPHLGARFFNWVKLNNVGCVTTENYNTMLYLAGYAEDFVSVERLMDEMSEFNCKKDVKTLNTVMMHYGKAKLIGMALSAFQTMTRSGVEPDVDAYRILIQLLCRFKKGDLALEFYKEMRQKGFELDCKLYQYLLNGIASCGDFDGVYLVANDMINVCSISEHDTYLPIVRWFCVTGRVKEALELIRYLNKKNVTLSPLFFKTLVKGLCKADRVDEALKIIDIMKSKNIVNEEVYGAVINGYLWREEASKALDLFHYMKGAGFTPLISTYTELMQHHFNSDEYEKGCALFNELLETRVKLDTVAYTAMIAGHVRFEHVSDAWKVLHSMEEEGIERTEKCFLVFIKELCRGPSSGDEIIKVLNFMLDSKMNIGQEFSNCVIAYLERKKDDVNLKHAKEILTPVRDCPKVGVSQDDS